MLFHQKILQKAVSQQIVESLKVMNDNTLEVRTASREMDETKNALSDISSEVSKSTRQIGEEIDQFRV